MQPSSLKPALHLYALQTLIIRIHKNQRMIYGKSQKNLYLNITKPQKKVFQVYYLKHFFLMLYIIVSYEYILTSSILLSRNTEDLSLNSSRTNIYSRKNPFARPKVRIQLFWGNRNNHLISSRQIHLNSADTQHFFQYFSIKNSQ